MGDKMETVQTVLVRIFFFSCGAMKIYFRATQRYGIRDFLFNIREIAACICTDVGDAEEIEE